ncbi:MAG: 50S ribosomal protein L10 [Planctomycetota bacterium]|nr:50S ribosomal protein L10 [Planctomycetota bacterium]
MSKYVKNLVVKDIAIRLDGVQDALLVNVVGLDANSTMALRRQLRQKDIHLLVVKNGLAKRAAEGTPLAAAFEGAGGTLAMIWGAQDFVSLAKEVVALDKSQVYKAFQTRGGVLDGECLTAERVKEISRWPNRPEQLSLLVGQILGPGARLAAQLIGPGGALASQIKEKATGSDAEDESTPTESSALEVGVESTPAESSTPEVGVESTPADASTPEVSGESTPAPSNTSEF